MKTGFTILTSGLNTGLSKAVRFLAGLITEAEIPVPVATEEVPTTNVTIGMADLSKVKGFVLTTDKEVTVDCYAAADDESPVSSFITDGAVMLTGKAVQKMLSPDGNVVTTLKITNAGEAAATVKAVVITSAD